jgi:uncharacterized protein YoaH (UPF0181 family)
MDSEVLHQGSRVGPSSLRTHVSGSVVGLLYGLIKMLIEREVEWKQQEVPSGLVSGQGIAFVAYFESLNRRRHQQQLTIAPYSPR